ncbi:Hypothetical predicted protein [Olea europaea subsp. europaea]|uniref:Uncharacterized protein n=1 Tax=Olea europaea subsp. europaea TaxID=158383 RepID=A0A8S0PC80_OLEEU|nr:Hypothetical predicted protein [Olea europaea subsp. europaea]
MAIRIKSTEKTKKVGRRLKSFAQSLNMYFSFNIVMAEDILDLDKDLFQLDAGEAVAVYTTYTLTAMIELDIRIENEELLMKLIRNINLHVVIVTEIEANSNSPIFVDDLFVEALFYYSAFFEFLADCMRDVEKNRVLGV